MSVASFWRAARLLVPSPPRRAWREKRPDRSCSNITQGLRLGLEPCDKPLDEQGESSGQTIQMSFPDALKHMLKETGYKIED